MIAMCWCCPTACSILLFYIIVVHTASTCHILVLVGTVDISCIVFMLYSDFCGYANF